MFKTDDLIINVEAHLCKGPVLDGFKWDHSTSRHESLLPVLPRKDQEKGWHNTVACFARSVPITFTQLDDLYFCHNIFEVNFEISSRLEMIRKQNSTRI